METDPVGSMLLADWFKISAWNSVSSDETLPSPCKANRLSPGTSSRLISPDSAAVKLTVANLINSGTIPRPASNEEPPIFEMMPTSSLISPLWKKLKLLPWSKPVAFNKLVGYLSEIDPPAIPLSSLFDWTQISATNWSPAETVCSEGGKRLAESVPDAEDRTTSFVVTKNDPVGSSLTLATAEVASEVSDSAVPWPSV